MHKDALLIDTSELSKIDTLKLAVKLIDRSGKLKLINRWYKSQNFVRVYILIFYIKLWEKILVNY